MPAHNELIRSAQPICAAWGDSPFSGLFHNLDKIERIGPVMVSKTYHLPGRTAIHEAAQFPSSILTWYPLLNRAWTFQEQMLSPRLLYITRHEIVWECMEGGRKCECCPSWDEDYPETFMPAKIEFARTIFAEAPPNTLALNGSDTDYDRKRLRSRVMVGWHRMVQYYCTCRLTFQSDILPAMSGLADIIQRRTGWQYLAGLWRECLVYNLCWYVNEHSPKQRQRTSYAPSWSWASIANGYIEILGFVTAIAGSLAKPLWKHFVHLEVLDAQCVLEGPSATGPVQAGFPLADITNRIKSRRDRQG